MTKITTTTIALALLATMNQVGANEYYRPWGAPYRQRIEGITVGAGNAKAVNEAAMVIDPWPPLVNNRRIPANGARMTGVIERYKDAKRLREQVPTLPPDLISSTGTGGSGGGGGGQ